MTDLNDKYHARRAIDFFEMDQLRHEMILKNNIEELRTSYIKVSKQLDKNTPDFWNLKIVNSDTSFHYDSVTKDRINSALNFLRKKKGNLIDIGIGYGYFEKKLIKKNKNFNIFGVDIANEGLEKLKKEIPGEFRTGSITNLPFGNKKFDFVVVMEVIEHIKANLAPKAYSEIKRVMKKDAQLIASIPINETYTIKNNPNQHMRRFSRELFLKELEINGFKVDRYKEFYAFKTFYWLKNILRKFFIRRWKPNIILVSCTIARG